MNYPEDIISKIDGPMFRDQRRVVLRLVDETHDTLSNIYFKEGEAEALEGLMNLLDAIADCAHDIYGIDCVLTEPELERKAEEDQYEQRIQTYNH